MDGSTVGTMLPPVAICTVVCKSSIRLTASLSLPMQSGIHIIRSLLRIDTNLRINIIIDITKGETYSAHMAENGKGSYPVRLVGRTSAALRLNQVSELQTGEVSTRANMLRSTPYAALEHIAAVSYRHSLLSQRRNE
jgi:hypothetical protein